MSKGPPSDAKIHLQSEHGKEKKCCIDRCQDITKDSVMESDITYQIKSKAEEIGSGSLSDYEGTSTNESDTFRCDYLLNPAETDQHALQSSEEWNANYVNRLDSQIAVIKECDSPSIEKIDNNNTVQDPQISIQNLMRTPQNEETSNSQKEISCAGNSAEEKYFYYEKPLYEETGMWIPVSVPPMSESEHKEWTKGICSNGGFISEGELGWDQTFGAEKELTMWDVVVEMLLVARGKVTNLASGDVTQISWISAHVIEQAWKEMAETLTEANFSNTQEILESEPPKWLPDSLASSCMLCSVRFHPIMCTRHHCRFCGGIFCSECTKGRSLLPEKFRTRDPQRVCDVCYVRLESVQPYLMDLVSRAAQLPTHDLTDLSTLRSWVNFPWGQSMEYEIYKATNTIRSYSKVGSFGPEKRIPESILRNALGFAILTVVKVGMMVTYNIGTGLVIARQEDGLWSPPSAVSSFGVGWGAQAGGELTDFIIVLRTNDAVKTFCSYAHVSIGAGLSAAVGIIGRTAEADIRAGPGSHAACYTYSCSKGAFVGCSLEGSVVTTRARENSRFYGSQFINASEILCGSLPRPPAAATLYRALDEMYMEIGSAILLFGRHEAVDRLNVGISWKPPYPGKLRLDVDASFDILKNSFSVGAVVRDNSGFVWGAKATAIRLQNSVFGAELEAIRFGMDFCLSRGFTNVCIFSDSLLAVLAVDRKTEILGPEGAIALEIRSLLESTEFISIGHMRRSANRVAHILAHKVLSSPHPFEWFNGCIPVWLSDVVKLDLLP